MAPLSVFDGARVPQSTVLEVELQAPWCCVVPKSEDTFLYVVRSGRCTLETEDLEAPLSLQAGRLWLMTPPRPFEVWRSAVHRG